MHFECCPGDRIRTQRIGYETIFEIGLLGGINRSLFFIARRFPYASKKVSISQVSSVE